MSTQPTFTDLQVLDRLGRERPNNFSLEEATAHIRNCGILDMLARDFGPVGTEQDAPQDWGCLLIQWGAIQDATFHTEIVLRHWDVTSPNERLSLRFSNFGNLAAVSALDETEPTPEVLSSIRAACAQAGYLLLGEEQLYEKWTDYHGEQKSAWSRFFDYV